MSPQNQEILDYPETPRKEVKEFKLIRILALASFIVALFMRFMHWPGHVYLIIAGALFFMLWSVLRFIYLEQKTLSEKIYLPGRILLVSGLTIRYSTYWLYDKYLVYIGLVLFVLGVFFSFREK